MAHLRDLPSLRKQHLLSEFTGLKQACPEGIFLSLTPGDPTLWSAVLFVRDGAYAPAVLRFQISFPEMYPSLPPLILFSTDIFHPLITPLTTYMYTTEVQDYGTVSAADQERLPPGGFSLRHGFPEWFARGGRPESAGRKVSGEGNVSSGPNQTCAPAEGSVTSTEPSNESSPGYRQNQRPNISIYSVLKYIRSTFDTSEVLDTVPLATAGNPGAWHAWRTHRRKRGKLSDQASSSSENVDADRTKVGSPGKTEKPAQSPTTATRQPGEWNWDGVWEDRVKKGVAASLSEPVLYGGSGVPDEMIRFLAMEEADVESVKENLRRTLGSAA